MRYLIGLFLFLIGTMVGNIIFASNYNEIKMPKRLIGVGSKVIMKDVHAPYNRVVYVYRILISNDGSVEYEVVSQYGPEDFISGFSRNKLELTKDAKEFRLERIK